jgi:hypothetical protein
MNEPKEAGGLNYFVLREAPSVERETAAKDGYVEIEDWDATEGFEDWGVGRVAENQPQNPVVINVVPHGGYAGLPDEYMDSNVPLMSKRLKEAIESAGVDNLRFLPITLRNAETGTTYDYFAFNLIGLVDAVDLGKSTMTSHDGDFVGDTAISDLGVDEAATRGLFMFRLKQKFSVILVHRKVKEAIERVGIPSVKFIAPEDFMAL